METKRHVIMLVDDNLTNLSIGKDMLKEHYDVFPIPSAEKLFAILGKVKPDLILLDVEMPGMDGYETIKKLKSDTETKDIPVIFLTAKSDTGSELEGLSLGAIDYVFKPFSPPLLIKRIENHLLLQSQQAELKDFNDNLQEMVRKRTEQVFDLQNAVLASVAELVEFRDDVTGGHIMRTQRYLKLLMEKILEKRVYWEETSTWNQEFLIPSAQLHDVGKIGISDTILNKPGKLTSEEFEIMKKHAEIGERAIEGIMKTTKEHDFLIHAKIFAGAHHEKWDGSGYPRGLKGEAIPLQGRIMAIADVYDALIALRPYKAPMSTEQANSIIMEGRGVHFDPVLVDLFGSLKDKFAEVAEKNRGGEA
ncbi:response regulator [Treponema primitia ZAS-2]|uniref:Response regulator n=1 Tax=Treponema primitia (strain ATCC BAA-887 / DSM 12427 / ZAS-2) TaxID=545694 RepID=F5YIW8_TREPZ|nr:HD domain-containing phosphohydrolase [Treponema primitia]AEF84555.1 response regulator [Treponema primitia ZAS-2]